MEEINIFLIGVIVVTVIVSFVGFKNSNFFTKHMFNVGAILKNKEYYRILSAGFLHADMGHLFFNMLTLFFFSPIILYAMGNSMFLIIYIGAILGGNLLSLFIKRNKLNYSAIGASGGVSGILFASILISPLMSIYFMFIPFPIPAWIYGILYILYSVYGMKSQLGNIGHEAHLGGALVGILLVLVMMPDLVGNNIQAILNEYIR